MKRESAATAAATASAVASWRNRVVQPFVEAAGVQLLPTFDVGRSQRFGGRGAIKDDPWDSLSTPFATCDEIPHVHFLCFDFFVKVLNYLTTFWSSSFGQLFD